MTFANSFLLAAFAGAGLLCVYFSHSLEAERKTVTTLSSELQRQTHARNTAEWLLQGQQQTMQVFSAIRAANRAARLLDEKKHNDAKQTISAAVAQDDCGDRAVPSAAADELRRLEEYARSISGIHTTD